MAKVIFKESSYDYKELRNSVFEILSALDNGIISKGTNVLIKPNILAPAFPEKALTTHPNVLRSVAEYALEKGANVQISDSTAMGSFEKALDMCGYNEALKGLPVSFKAFEESRTVDVDGPFPKIELAADALDTEVLINLPKLKTHSQMALTLAVKNLFGCVVGARKPEWHFRVGENKELFAELLASIYGTLKPSLNLMDGILAMEGEGPGTSGRPRELGVLIGSENAMALDMAVCEMLKMKPYSLMTNHAGKKLGLAPSCTEMIGCVPSVTDFDIPEPTDLLFGPRIARGFLRKHIASRPVNVPDICKYCNECVKICPAKAIENRTGSKLNFDYNACIRCYCCVEVCPYAAMVKHDTLIKKLVRKILVKRRVLDKDPSTCKH
jgi:uncharacterized protein (DUF362 family)/Pyruvate/2-oxoacid:ferredoxin oxidoreductase delta subunit